MLRSWSCGRHQCLFRSTAINASRRSNPAKRPFSAPSHHASLERTRNIGIIAHIDAGKTTTTERMLYYSGYTRRLGDVDEGSTVTDFLPAERARGITIQSAAISFAWPPAPPGQTAVSLKPNTPFSSVPHNINLIDTPGHADFTFEVLRSLRVLDGAVCILDGVAGVEAQTEKVWAQSLHHSIPRIVFVNKLDRDGAAFGKTVKEIGARLGVWPAVCSIPWWTSSGGLRGVADVINLRGLEYLEGGDGKQINVFSLQQLEEKEPALADELKKARVALVELLSEHDDVMVEKYFETDDDHTAIAPIDIIESLRRCTLSHPQKLSAVFAGASFRNVGVQPLLDAVVDLLPAPSERPDPEISLNQDTRGGLSQFLAGSLKPSTTPHSTPGKKALSKEKSSFALQKIESCALAFKVVADAKRGSLVYVRVYSGSIASNSGLWNTNLQVMERSQRLMKMYANDAVDVESIPAGQIGVIPALKFTRTGDTLVSYTGANPKTGPPAPVSSIQLKPIDIPPPVFFVSVEANSLSEEKHIKESLDLLLREDPSLHVSVDEESGQTHLAGMGELHLEIARDRLIQDLKAKARIGNIEIGYREAITNDSEEITEIFDREVQGKSSKAGCTLTVSPRDGSKTCQAHVFELLDNNLLTVMTPTLHEDGSPVEPEQSDLPEDLPLPTILQAFSNGVSAALARGPSHGYPIHSIHIELTFDHTKHLFQNTRPSALSSAARIAVQKAMKQSAKTSQTVMMEPVMQVTISVDEASLGSVVHDISSARGGSVISLGGSEEDEQQSDSAAQTRLSFKDLERIYAPPDPFAGGNAASAVDMESANAAGTRQIVARVPLKEMVGYLKHLRSLTAGRGTFTMVVDRFEKMAAQRQKAVLNEMRGEY